MSLYDETLAAAKRVGSSKRTDAEVMALFCATALQQLVGAASPRLVWEGAQRKGMTARDLVELATTDYAAVHELMWL